MRSVNAVWGRPKPSAASSATADTAASILLPHPSTTSVHSSKPEPREGTIESTRSALPSCQHIPRSDVWQSRWEDHQDSGGYIARQSLCSGSLSGIALWEKRRTASTACANWLRASTCRNDWCSVQLSVLRGCRPRADAGHEAPLAVRASVLRQRRRPACTFCCNQKCSLGEEPLTQGGVTQLHRQHIQRQLRGCSKLQGNQLQ